jgi:hypothetical protein
MFDVDQVTEFYRQSAGAEDDEALLDAAKGVFDAPEEYADYILSAAKAKGLELSRELKELEQYSRAAREKAQREQTRERAQESLTSLNKVMEQYGNNLEKGHGPEEPEMLEAAVFMAEKCEHLKAPSEVRGVCRFQDYLEKCRHYDPDKDFRPELFQLPFPNGTVSYIGARTSRGKTAALLNLAREAMTAPSPRKVVFITLEMSPQQLLTRLVLGLLYAAARARGEHPALERRENPMRDYYCLQRGVSIPGGPEENRELVEGFPRALHTLQTAMESQAFVLYDGRGASLDALLLAIKERADKGTLVLIDYIQRMPTPKGFLDSGYARVKEISDKVMGVAASSDAVILAGAQFHRSQDKDHPESKQRDTFDDTSFRESGDLEQDAHCAIGLGWWKDDPNRRFFEVLKVRDGAIPKKPTELLWCGPFQYMANSGQALAKGNTGEKPSVSLKGGCHR